jgi:hypothetical protein
MAKRFFLVLWVLLAVISCKRPSKAQDIPVSINVPVFNADSAYQYTANQVAFGPRVPNTPAHVACGNYLSGELKRFGAEVIQQEATLYLVDNTPIRIKNIIGSFQPAEKNRILLFAHWDSRPYADNDPNRENWAKPIDGANDGAGACAVLLEIARQIAANQPTVGLDIIFFDAEDWGMSGSWLNNGHYGDWCMGSKYWAQHPHLPNYTAKYGILLDMVSAPNAQFHYELYSLQYARKVVQKVWETAQAIGYGAYFVSEEGGGIVDDHVEVIKYRKFPCIDIIQYDRTDSGFGAYWHTLDDTMDNVSKETLKAVGQTLLHVLYHEK